MNGLVPSDQNSIFPACGGMLGLLLVSNLHENHVHINQTFYSGRQRMNHTLFCSND